MYNTGDILENIETGRDVVVVSDFGDIVKVVESEPLPADPYDLTEDGRVLLARNADVQSEEVHISCLVAAEDL